LIDFRYHVVSIVAVFLALALGLFLGSTTLQSTVTRNLHHQANVVTGRNRALLAQNGLLSKQLGDEQGFMAAVEPYAVADKLVGETVALVSAPGVDGGLRKSVSATLTLAGATVTADVQIQPGYLDPSQDAALGELALNLALPRHPLPQGNGAVQMSSVLANVLVARPGRPAVPRGRVDAALNSLSDGKFISVSGSLPDRPADLAVFLVSAPVATTANAVRQQNSELLGLATDLRNASGGTVVAGPTPLPGTSGDALSAVRGDQSLATTVSTVTIDSVGSNADPAAGRIAIVVALAAAPDGTFGSYGLGWQPPLPSPSSSP
jgi:Copper transport outer membrane protein, MctB